MIIWGVHCQGFSSTPSRYVYVYTYIYPDNAKSTRVVVVRLSPALPSLVVYSKTEAKILDSGDQCKLRLNAATKYRHLYTETQTQ